VLNYNPPQWQKENQNNEIAYLWKTIYSGVSTAKSRTERHINSEQAKLSH
jgi:hypothetical protein